MAILLATFGLRAQGTVDGQIITEGGQPAEFVNVMLLAAKDSTLAHMDLSDTRGGYVFKDVEAGDYRLKITGIGFADHLSEAFTLADKATKTLPVVRLTTMVTTLDAVEVVARKPLLEQQAGKLVVNVDQNITGQGGSVTDLLKKVPGLVVVNDRVSMAGRQGVAIHIDGRPTKFMDIQALLNEMPADNISRIEVISQPGAAYDAEGIGGIINIVLKKNAIFGTNGSVTTGFGYGELPKYRINTNLNHRSGPWNLNFAAGYNRREGLERLDLERILPDRTFAQRSKEIYKPNSYYLNTSADYDINDRHRIGIAANGNYTANQVAGTNTTEETTPEGAMLQQFTSLRSTDRTWRSITTDAFYDWEIDTTGQKLSINANFADYRRTAANSLMTNIADFPDRRNQQPATTNIYAAQIDYKKPLTKQWNMESGLKASNTRLDNRQDAEVLLDGTWERDVISSTFDYSEDIYAAYTNLAYSKGEWQANIGLRYEDSKATGYSVNYLGQDSTVNINISRFFPSLSLTTPFVGNLGTSWSYSHRIQRPAYFDLNPFRDFLDPLTSSKGNPFLVPELTHSGQFSLTYEKQPFFNLSYDYTQDVLTEVIEQDDATGEAFQTNVNLDKYIRYGGSLFFPLDFIAKPISGYGGFMLFYHDYQSDFLNQDYLQNQWTTNAFLQVNVNLPKDWKLEVTGWMQGAGLDGIIRFETFYGLDAGLQKKFLDDKLRVQFSADGIVQKFFEGKVTYANLNYNLLSAWEAPVFQTRITWNFGNQNLEGREKRKAASETERERLNGN